MTGERSRYDHLAGDEPELEAIREQRRRDRAEYEADRGRDDSREVDT